ncbi:hypothetical protein BU17DRAFT_62471 [Hysterangium stoloniferum]|nr:hypothetical protein BU17DRAFT_62471 [Hysterangium stoloniferum]
MKVFVNKTKAKFWTKIPYESGWSDHRQTKAQDDFKPASDTKWSSSRQRGYEDSNNLTATDRRCRLTTRCIFEKVFESDIWHCRRAKQNFAHWINGTQAKLILRLFTEVYGLWEVQLQYLDLPEMSPTWVKSQLPTKRLVPSGGHRFIQIVDTPPRADNPSCMLRGSVTMSSRQTFHVICSAEVPLTAGDHSHSARNRIIGRELINNNPDSLGVNELRIVKANDGDRSTADWRQPHELDPIPHLHNRTPSPTPTIEPPPRTIESSPRTIEPPPRTIEPTPHNRAPTPHNRAPTPTIEPTPHNRTHPAQ